MKPEDAAKLPRHQPDPDLAGLPDWLKDPQNFEYVEKRLMDKLANPCSHSDPQEWGECTSCQDKVKERKKEMERLGFKTPQQYLKWKKTMEIMRERFKSKFEVTPEEMKKYFGDN